MPCLFCNFTWIVHNRRIPPNPVNFEVSVNFVNFTETEQTWRDLPDLPPGTWGWSSESRGEYGDWCHHDHQSQSGADTRHLDTRQIATFSLFNFILQLFYFILFLCIYLLLCWYDTLVRRRHWTCSRYRDKHIFPMSCLVATFLQNLAPVLPS